MADAYDEHGAPLYLQDCLTVCPVAHIDEAREIAAWHCGNVENLIDALPANMLPMAIGPLGGSVTHYACFQRLFQSGIDRERVTLTTQAAEESWIDGSDSPDDPLNKFCCISTNLNDFMTTFGMEVK